MMHFSHTINQTLETCNKTCVDCHGRAWVLLENCSCGAAEIIDNYRCQNLPTVNNIRTNVLATLPCVLKARLKQKYKPNFHMIKLLEKIDFYIMWAADATDIASSIGYDLKIFNTYGSNKATLKDTAVTEYES